MRALLAVLTVLSSLPVPVAAAAVLTAGDLRVSFVGERDAFLGAIEFTTRGCRRSGVTLGALE